jgi:hypothetical protein
MLAIGLTACVVHSPNPFAPPEDYSAAENTCVHSCGWPTELPACFREPLASAHANRELPRLLIHLESIVVVPENQCLCLDVLLGEKGEVAGVNVTFYTNAETSRAVRDALLAAPVGTPIPDGAECLASTPIPVSLGGTRVQ